MTELEKSLFFNIRGKGHQHTLENKKCRSSGEQDVPKGPK